MISVPAGGAAFTFEELEPEHLGLEGDGLSFFSGIAYSGLCPPERGEREMVFRQRMLFTVSDLGAWNETIALVEEMNKLCASKGWAQGTLFTRTVGRFNELCLEFDYPDLATFQRENEEWLAEPGIGDLMRRIDAVSTEDPGYSELWEEATPVPLS